MLTTLSRMKKALQMDENDSSMDETLAMYAEAASQKIEAHLKRSLKRAIYQERVSGYANSPYLNLKQHPIIGSVSLTDMNGAAIEPDFLLPEEGRLFRNYGWPNGKHNIIVEYEAGYVLPQDASQGNPRTLPEPIELACLLYAQTLMRSPGVIAERFGNVSITYTEPSEGLPLAVCSLLAPYVGSWV
ncbi:phage head-tail connector protein [Paenibacillus sp. OV219]|uniref:phage head-tail connector protein n=1 Tax=Paenibacillus sp. OV219 TaxID=1884377 RepID=UPI0008BA4534|nr:phage head-tail connector protein [Paenibacillus sp. OV219]SEM81604.1 Phage gp6-like head-tail connector protein [Paenibacillus sp. OV219]